VIAAQGWDHMIDANIYYCWACDAHCKAVVESANRAKCPHCGRTLTDDSKLVTRSAIIEPLFSQQANVWAAPVRPRLAASA